MQNWSQVDNESPRPHPGMNRWSGGARPKTVEVSRRSAYGDPDKHIMDTGENEGADFFPDESPRPGTRMAKSGLPPTRPYIKYNSFANYWPDAQGGSFEEALWGGNKKRRTLVKIIFQTIVEKRNSSSCRRHHRRQSVTNNDYNNFILWQKEREKEKGFSTVFLFLSKPEKKSKEWKERKKERKKERPPRKVLNSAKCGSVREKDVFVDFYFCCCCNRVARPAGLYDSLDDRHLAAGSWSAK